MAKTIVEFPHTFQPCNIELLNKEFILQKTKRGYRCISYFPHYIETLWYKNKEDAIANADKIIDEFYESWYNEQD
jgi:hypothetical protein